MAAGEHHSHALNPEPSAVLLFAFGSSVFENKGAQNLISCIIQQFFSEFMIYLLELTADLSI